MSEFKSDIEIARAARLLPIGEVAARLGIPADALCQYGSDKAKVRFDFLEQLEDRPDGKLVLVTAITPTPAGEGKTTTTVGLGDALNRIGKRATICLREPSLGPCFGMKGGAAGGGYAQVVPMEDINLHFTGDFHAIGTAHNLLAALIDNHLYWGNELGIDARRITWRRVIDMNDRALRQIVSSLGGVANGFPREDGFDITVASEVMAIFCLARDLHDLEQRLGKVIVGHTRERRPVTAADLKAAGPMTVLLKDALMPNLVQTLENNPAFVHGGPFANIAHGCNSVIATRTALKLSDYVVTEAGFGADLGAEKFFDIKCRKAGLAPDAAVIVATVRALKMHGGVAREHLAKENLEALRKGIANLARHVRTCAASACPRWSRSTTSRATPTPSTRSCASSAAASGSTRSPAATGPRAAPAPRRSPSTSSTCARARAISTAAASNCSIRTTCRSGTSSRPSRSRSTAPRRSSPTRRSARQLRGVAGAGLRPLPGLHRQDPVQLLDRPQPQGRAVAPRRADPRGPPRHGAEFVVAICGDIMTMPGLPRVPAANSIRIDAGGQVEGLF